MKKRLKEYSSQFTIEHRAQVISEHKNNYTLQTLKGEMRGEITGNMRYAAQSKADLPSVGDWVEIMLMDENQAIIVRILERKNLLKRKKINTQSDIQPIAANLDMVFITQAATHDFNLNRFDRYYSLCRSTEISVAAVLTKIDLCTEKALETMKKQLFQRYPSINIYTVSSERIASYASFEQQLKPKQTYAFLGSSGVGKSTLINYLLGHEVQQTQGISTFNDKGKHTTTRRSLFYAASGFAVLDTPGMKLIGLTQDDHEVKEVFDEIQQLSLSCQFKNCTHTNEKGCAVLAALKEDRLSEQAYRNYLKLHKEQDFFSASLHERKQNEKQLSKMITRVKKHKKRLSDLS